MYSTEVIKKSTNTCNDGLHKYVAKFSICFITINASSTVISLLYFIILGDVTVSTDSPAGTTQGLKQTTVAAATTEEASVTPTPTSKVTSDKGTTVEDRPTTTSTTEVTTEFRETTLEVDVETTRPEPSTRPPQPTTLSSSSSATTTRVYPTTAAGATTTEVAATTIRENEETTPVLTTADTGTTLGSRHSTTLDGVKTTEERETTPMIEVETTRPEPSTRPHRPTSPSVSTRPLPESTTRDYFSQHTTIDIVTLPTRMMTTDESSPEPPTRPRPRCPPIMAPMHGSYRRYDWYRRGEKVVFSCDHNYVLIGPEWIICFDGEWSGSVPECKSEYSFPDSYIQWCMFAKCMKW